MRAKFNLPKRNLCANFNIPDHSMSASFEMSNGTKNYEKLENKPSINGVELIGNKTSSDLGLATSAQGALAETALQEVPSYYITETELASELSTKQNVISDLSEIREGASLGATSVQPDDISDMATMTWVEGKGYTNNIGTVTSVNGIEPVDGNVTITIPSQVNADWNATSGVAEILNKPTIPTDTGDLTNNAGYIKGINNTDVINALGYTPYDSSNPNSYTSNIGTVTSVNGNTPDSSGNVVITIPDSATWGNITGTLSNQTDLQNALNAKADTSSLATVATSGNYNDLTNKPSINNVTLSGNKTSSNLSLQDKLVSGTNIKTINNTSLLGSGNITIEGTSGADTSIYVAHMPPEKVFAAGESNASCTSSETYSFDTLKYLDYIIKATTGNPYGNENYGVYKDNNNYIQTQSNGYSKNFIIRINGTTLLTQAISGYVDNISGYTDLRAHFDFIRKIFVVEVMNANTANPVEKVRIDFSSYDISGLTDFKIIANIGRYAASIFSESIYVNNLMNYKSLLTQHYNVNSYNALVTYNNSRRCVSPSSLYLGNTTTTITNTHKIATINRTGGYYAIGSYGSWSGDVGLNLVKLKVYDVNTAPVFNNGAGNRGLMFFNYDTGEYVGAAGFTPTEDVWYLFVINMGSGIDYTVNYSVNLKGDCKIEAEAVAVMMPQSINLCAETYNGSYFTGAVPFKVGNTTFTTPSFSTSSTGRNVPKGALNYASNGGVSIYNGTAWKAIAS